eukprot:CAMPEP_0118930306 /NCGR_PEP_ID=MMETSP1169-20130426/7038_1 /TAXON_ID=36882 /ORGANISM="Pyramimonas obovata, Strain CCMP722" /LENGTH=252 /DNA_ID=CAMNT_0006872637 /DNA_START=572 /DNA_END=1327 /DNA_ORIENTATION=+
MGRMLDMRIWKPVAILSPHILARLVNPLGSHTALRLSLAPANQTRYRAIQQRATQASARLLSGVIHNPYQRPHSRTQPTKAMPRQTHVPVSTASLHLATTTEPHCQVFIERRSGAIEPARFEKSMFLALTTDESKLTERVGLSYISTKDSLSVVISELRRPAIGGAATNNTSEAEGTPPPAEGADAKPEKGAGADAEPQDRAAEAPSAVGSLEPQEPWVLFGRSPIDPILHLQQMGMPWCHPRNPFVKLAVV